MASVWFNVPIFVCVLTRIQALPLDEDADSMPDLSYLGDRVYR